MLYAVEDRPAAFEGRAAPKRQPLPESLTDPTATCALITPGRVGLSVGRLAYLPICARAEPIRLILHYTGLPYEMSYVPFAEWPQAEPSTPMELLHPTFTTMGGDVIRDEILIAKYICGMANMPGLMPGNNDDCAEQLYAICSQPPLSTLDALTNGLSTMDVGEQQEELLAACATALNKIWLDFMGNTPFSGGDAPSYGEFALMHVMLSLRKADATSVSSLGERCMAWFDRMCALPRIERYLKSRSWSI